MNWRRINIEPFEYAIQQGPHGDEFVKLLDGSFLRRAIMTNEEKLNRAIDFIHRIADNECTNAQQEARDILRVIMPEKLHTWNGAYGITPRGGTIVEEL